MTRAGPRDLVKRIQMLLWIVRDPSGASGAVRRNCNGTRISRGGRFRWGVLITDSRSVITLHPPWADLLQSLSIRLRTRV